MSLSKLKQTFIKNKEDFMWGPYGPGGGPCGWFPALEHSFYGIGIFMVSLIIYFITNQVLRFNKYILTIKKVLIVFVICSIFMFYVMFDKLYDHNKHDCITDDQLKTSIIVGYIILVLLIFLMYKGMFRDFNLKLNKLKIK